MDVPEAHWKTVFTTTFVDENLMHDVVNEKSARGIIHMIKKTPIECLRKS